MEEALWMNMETSKRQREWRDRSIAERKAAKRARHIQSSPPDHQSTSKGEGSGARRTGSTPHSPPPAATVTPRHQSQMEVDNDEARVTPSGSAEGDAEKGAKGKGKTTKR